MLSLEIKRRKSLAAETAQVIAEDNIGLVRQVIGFGSLFREESKWFSDIDICVVADREMIATERNEIWASVRTALRGDKNKGLTGGRGLDEIDMVILPEKRFQNPPPEYGSEFSELVENIKQEGVVLWP